MTVGHMSDQTRWEIEELMLRYRDHATACEANSRRAFDVTVAQQNFERANVWHQRANEQQAKLAAYDKART